MKLGEARALILMLPAATRLRVPRHHIASKDAGRAIRGLARNGALV
jgi:hypothetical protein